VKTDPDNFEFDEEYKPVLPLTWLEPGPLYPGLYNLVDAKQMMLAWIQARPEYCDRGHWKGMVDCVQYLTDQDGWPNYYMSFERAKAEVHAFIMWRLFKQRYRGD